MTVFAGHIGVALAVGRVERRVNVGVFVAAALLLDILLWLFVLIGWESVTIPADFATTHQPDFVFPYSHGLLAGAAWSVLAGGAAFVMGSRRRGEGTRRALLVAAAVFSHWLLDALVHRPEMPLAGAASPRVGVGLWNDMPVALAIEAALVIAGVGMFVPGSALPRARTVALAVLGLVVLAFTILGMTVAPPPPSALAMAATSLLTVAAVCALCAWLGRLSPGAGP